MKNESECYELDFRNLIYNNLERDVELNNYFNSFVIYRLLYTMENGDRLYYFSKEDTLDEGYLFYIEKENILYYIDLTNGIMRKLTNEDSFVPSFMESRSSIGTGAMVGIVSDYVEFLGKAFENLDELELEIAREFLIETFKNNWTLGELYEQFEK